MKFFRNLLIISAVGIISVSCKKANTNLWNIHIAETPKKVEIVDISNEFYNLSIPLDQFKTKFPFFQGTVSDEDYAARRQDSQEIKIYNEAVLKIDQVKLGNDLQNLFSHIRFYFPKFKNPTVFLYSSALQGAKDPVFYKTDANMIFIDISGFMGENNPNYKGLEQYFQRSMNPQNIVPKVSEIIAENFVPANMEHQKFLDQMIYQGKLMTLQDAFLPNFPDFVKMNYTLQQYEWAQANEANIWNYFVENNLLFSDDVTLAERFLTPGPFSKFYTEIDRESSPQIGIFSGWQVCRKFFERKPDTKLQTFLKMDALEIFNESHYKPKN